MLRLHCAALVLGAIAAPAHAAADVEAGEQGLTLKSGDVELNLGGRLYLDAAVFDPGNKLADGTAAKVRRARLELSGRLGEGVRFRVDREFAGRSAGWRNVWVELRAPHKVAVRGGNFVAPFSMERLESANTSAFVQRSLASALAPGYGLGGSISASGSRWSLSGGWFDDPLGNEGSSVERGRGLVARATLVPVKGHRRLIHLGAAIERRSFDHGEKIRFSADPGSALAPTLISSHAIGRLQTMLAWNGEASAALGSLLIRGEANGIHLDRTRSDTADFSGRLVQASWLVTGERYDYSPAAGLFGGPHLRRGKPAVELAMRYSRLDLDSDHIHRGIASEITTGANLYFNRNIRLMLDYSYARNHFPGAEADVDDHVGAARFQLSY